MRRIVINKDEVVLEEVETRSRTSIASFLQIVKQNKAVVTPVLPNGTVLYKEDSDGSTLIIEHPPQTRELAYKTKKYRIAFPYHYFILKFYSKGGLRAVKLMFRNSTLKTPDDELCWSPLPNTGRDGIICVGDRLKVRPSDPLRRKAGLVVADYLSSTFNDDLREMMQEKQPPQITEKVTKPARGEDLTPIFKAWAALTKEGKDVLQFGWQRYGTAADVM